MILLIAVRYQRQVRSRFHRPVPHVCSRQPGSNARRVGQLTRLHKTTLLRQLVNTERSERPSTNSPHEPLALAFRGELTRLNGASSEHAVERLVNHVEALQAGVIVGALDDSIDAVRLRHPPRFPHGFSWKTTRSREVSAVQRG